ncbi:sperm flagellar protein 2 isoform X3 [Triplophysa rosa]|uniref:sperm flagellar protein 2 isoform X3 n=1 Tax=Triplophysa rosa TaxID=992332 RepID=UPI002545F248|nr:sperm flagellar protein 2 isoform X3 [Triplophysa rosa]
MSGIICEWLNAELRLSKVVAPVSLSRDFANGFLIGEILNRFELQDDFHLFSKHSTPNAKLNNFTRLEPTLHLLGVPFDLSMSRAVMQGKQGAVTNLLYQLYIVLQKKKRSRLTATAMQVMQPAAAARLHRVEKHIYTERLKTVVRREADVKMQKIAKRFHKRGQDMYHQSIMTELQQEKERIGRQEERRMRDIEKHRQARRRQQDMMIQIQSAVLQIPKPPHSRSPRALEKQQQIRKQQDAQLVRRDIAQFEKNQKSISHAGDGALLSSGHVMSAHDREQRIHGEHPSASGGRLDCTRAERDAQTSSSRRTTASTADSTGGDTRAADGEEIDASDATGEANRLPADADQRTEGNPATEPHLPGETEPGATPSGFPRGPGQRSSSAARGASGSQRGDSRGTPATQATRRRTRPSSIPQTLPRLQRDSGTDCGSEHQSRRISTPHRQEISQYLVPYWENMCSSYETNVKTVMQNLRSERELIIHHLYDIRENFRQHLLKPDLKQEFVSSWQSDYNRVPDNIRDDEETKGELHQRLDDLRERLWDICDKRRDEAVLERAAVVDDGWLDDHTALIINHYCTLIQTEVSRCQGGVYLLRDYYSGMNKALLPQSSCDSTRLPLLDVTWSENMEPETSNISSVSGPSEKHAKNAGKKDTEAEDTRKLFPLVTSRSSSNEISKQDLRRPDEKLLEEIYQTAISAVCAEVQRREHEEGDEEQHQTMETQRANTQSQASNSAKDRKKTAKQKGAPPPPSHEPSPQLAADENPEEVKRRATRRRIRQEYTAALKHEERGVTMRLDVLKSHAVRTLRSLQRNTQELYTNTQEWMETRYLSEMSSVEQLTELVRRHIENGLQIRHELVLHAADFCVDGDTRVLASAPPTPPPPLLEEHRDSRLTVQQLNIICAQLHKTAPSGVLSGTELTEVLQEFISPHMGCDDLPQPWTHVTSSQVVELVCAFTGDSEMLDWRQFVLSVALPWPFPSRTQLLKTLQRFRAVDGAGTGLITLEQYTQVELWFPSDKHHPSEPLTYERLDNLKKFFFSLFASTHSSPVMLDYMNMLLYFCCHPEASQGFIRALGLVTEHTLHYKHTGALVQSVAHLEGADVEEVDADDVRGAEPDGEGVSVDDVLRVLSHGQNLTSAHPNRFHWSCRSRDQYREELLKVYKELDFKAEEKIPFSVLSQHPFLQDLIEASSQYLLVDVHKILQTQKNEGDCKS